jgi:uncharacterized membrane protein (TIGR02234 family)
VSAPLPVDPPDSRGYRFALGTLSLGAVLLLSAFSRPWATVPVGGSGLPTLTVELSGRDLLPAGAAAAVVAFAGLAGLVATRRVGRRISGALLLLAGLGAAAACLQFGLTATHPDGAGAVIDRLVSEKVGIDVVASPAAHVALWWLAALVGGVLVALAGAQALARCAHWPEMGRRYTRDAAGDPAHAPRTPVRESAWDALDRGVDPTADPGTDP